ncbi:MAG: GWxTD domain-containing protein [Candidatus Kapabacteria bacterium]|nr:GWxTD domain-containing protein [Candidatus Kapabacteria bacterium]
MMTCRTTLLVLATLFVGVASPLTAQRANRVQRATVGEYGDKLYADAMMLPRAGIDSADIFVSFRVAHDALTFTRVTDQNNSKGNFSAEFTLSVEVRDSIGVIRSRVRFKDTAYVNSYDASIDRSAMHHGSCRIGIAPGTYRVVLETLGQRETTKRTVTLSQLSFLPASKGLMIPGYIGTERRDGETWMVESLVFNRNVPFGAKPCVAMFIVSDTSTTAYDYAIHQLPYGPKDIRWWVDADYTGTVRSRSDIALEGRFESDRAARALLKTRQTSRYATVIVPIDVPQLVPGSYIVRLAKKGSKDTVELPFQVQWETMPQSLRTLSYALESLVYICPEDQLDSLTEGSDAENRERLMSWWRRSDPTPTTAFNERLAEYYTRVDHAAVAFSSVNEPDGTFTDRGKVFILFGRPTKIDKKLGRAGSTTELWVYRSGVRKTFEFSVNSDGIYKLVSSTDTK